MHLLYRKGGRKKIIPHSCHKGITIVPMMKKIFTRSKHISVFASKLDLLLVEEISKCCNVVMLLVCSTQLKWQTTAGVFRQQRLQISLLLLRSLQSLGRFL